MIRKKNCGSKTQMNASNDEKLQKPIKQHRGQRKAHRPLKKAKSEKRGFFHFPIFHITCIIRNICNQKIRPPFSSDFACGDLIAAYSCRCSLFWGCDVELSIQGNFGKLVTVLRLCAKVCTDSFVINTCSLFAAVFAAKLCNIGFARHKALLCQNRRTVYVFQ